ncbi:MAG TPA: hypothetical protein VIK14_09680 [Ignavibacteria bacterium]
MKTNLIFLVLLIACFSCGTNKPVSDTEKDKIKGQVKEVVNTIIKGCEEANFDSTIEPWLDSPDLVFINNGSILSYKDMVDGIKPLFNTLINQKVTIINEKYAFPDKSTVIYTTNCKFLENYKDGHSILSDPMAMQFTFKKINNKWKVINGVESSVRQNVKNSETSKELNQLELLKQFAGTWKGEIGKDTIYIAEQKLFGTGLLSTIKTVTKGKTIMEGQTIIGYDKKSDKIIETDLIEGSDIMVYGIWFTSKNTCIEIPYENVSNPENAPVTWQYEFKSPDLMVWNYIENNKTTKSMTFHREK